MSESCGYVYRWPATVTGVPVSLPCAWDKAKHPPESQSHDWVPTPAEDAAPEDCRCGGDGWRMECPVHDLPTPPTTPAEGAG